MEQISNIRQSIGFYESAIDAVTSISAQLDIFYRDGKTVVIWGGTGKAAAFMLRYDVDRQRFPYVVDSDQDKVGTFVPGTGQIIMSTSWFQDHSADIIIIPPQWRAKDILNEIKNKNIFVDTVLIEHEGFLIDYLKDSHPYL